LTSTESGRLYTSDNSFTGPTIAADGARSPSCSVTLLWCYGWCYGLAGITVCSAGEWSPAWRASSKASDSGPPRAQVGWFSWTPLREFEVQPNGYEPRSLFLALLRDRDLPGVAGVQDHREE